MTTEMTARDSALTEEVKAAKNKQDRFAGEAEALLQEIRVFRGQPGWNELAPILKNSRTTPNRATALKAWGDKWKQPPDTVSQRFQQLVERSAAIDKRRKDLLATWDDIKTREGELLRSSGRFNARNIDSIVSQQTLSYDVNRVTLKSYGLDELGLFHAHQSSGPP